MRRKVIAVLVGSLSLWALAACHDLSETECLKLRGQAFDILNDQNHDHPQTCADDADCYASEWPGCPMPINGKNKDRITPIKDKFDKGNCKEPASQCPDTPLMYCKQGLCVSKHVAGEKGNTTK